MAGRIKVVRETDSGRNEQFQDTKTGRVMNRTEFVREIENNQYKKYHVRVVNGVKTPASNPDGSENNNLG